MKKNAWLFLCLSGLLAALPAHGASKPVGYVMTVQGNVTTTLKGTPTVIKVGTPVSVGTTFETGENGSFGITLEDGSVMSFGPQSTFTLEAFQFAPAKGALKLAASLKRGTLNYVAGTIARLKPEAVEILTPNGTIASRSAQFMAKIDHE
ncbi:FecR domain-containing protein [Pseudomonas asuensis]|uniref:FecR protein domain-containing protein n=1 Tax=Pseudomonas asuensis TaxID=1825787 RepID=A0ABQ2H0Q2_9PSED|nr:FecR domain-containing protein [Pseudomonas asuensis]GGM20854.1 hypothetical protein GCM10009425_34720 [Pseudomonas asuensis]